MIRRDPTRIELTLDDIQEYHLRVKQEAEAKRTSSKIGGTSSVVDTSVSGESGATVVAKTKTETVHERIGYNPTPRSS